VETAVAVNDEWACVAVFEFAGATETFEETRELYRGTESNCLRLLDRLGKAADAGRGLIYDGPPVPGELLYAHAVVVRVEDA
jgi:hypothetical protein